MKFKISSIHFTSIFRIFFVFVFQFHSSINRIQNSYGGSTFNRTTSSFIMLNSLHALSHKSFSEENDPLKNQILTILKCLKNLKISPLLKTTRLVFQLSSNIPIFATSRSYDAMSTGNLINSDEV